MHGLRWLVVLGTSLAVTGCGGGSPASPTSPTATTPPAAATPASPAPATPVTPPVSTGTVTWQFNGQTWQSVGTPPACPSPLVIGTPVDLARVTSILYPGQRRNEYKAHGGFRFDGPGQTAAVTVTAPMDGTVLRGARYLEGGELQFLFDVVNSCGVLFRFDHLRELSPRFQAMADALPAAAEGASATTLITGQSVASGETIATAIGLRGNVAVDFGLYDLRSRNASSADPAWLSSHPGELAPYGICWLDNLSAGDAARVRALPPGDQQAGRTSDYCR